MLLASIIISCFSVYEKHGEYVDHERFLRESIKPKDLPEQVIQKAITDNKQHQYTYERYEREVVRLLLP